ncbi:glycosyltransferase [Maribacter ulvicola]|uniref:Glycosyltransferase like family 2 n=1 Tax=Maribacter ulvicola TaxID=228959 RepID=A0A1N6SDL1_9FLAO|nr:glycosyltransferase [Maribacter ulvicola]SIQ39223.1 Glycosyltransferase like family 2 [Maribacter ulvicola]
MVKLSIIISYYKGLDKLKLILKALNNQSNFEFEAIISEDDNNSETIKFLDQEQKNYSFSILHVHQETDNGFRKNQMLNKSIKISNADTLAFIDGDCIPHKHFAKTYINNIQKGFMLKGRRVNLGEQITKEIHRNNDIGLLNLIRIFKSDSKKKKEALYTAPFSLVWSMTNKGLLGCNWGISKEHLIAINGFDEDYVKAAVGEDTDIEWRLKANGIKSISVKNKAIVYHLYHEKGYSAEDVAHNRELLKTKLQENNFVCINGLERKKQ